MVRFIIESGFTINWKNLDNRPLKFGMDSLFDEIKDDQMIKRILIILIFGYFMSIATIIMEILVFKYFKK